MKALPESDYHKMTKKIKKKQFLSFFIGSILKWRSSINNVLCTSQNITGTCHFKMLSTAIAWDPQDCLFIESDHMAHHMTILKRSTRLPLNYVSP